MLESYVRPSCQHYFLDPLARLLQRFSFVKPNSITFLAVALGVLSPILFLMHHAVVAVVLLLLSGLCDSLDGTVARMSNRSTQTGAALDIVGDRIVEFAVIVAFYFIDPSRNALGVLMMLGASYLCVTTFLVVGIFAENSSMKSFHYSVGLFERAEAFAFFIVMMLFPSTIMWLAWVYFVLVMFTAGVRIVEFYHQGRL